MEGLTDRQQQVLNFIRHCRIEHDFVPSVRDICAHFSFAINSGTGHLEALYKKGALKPPEAIDKTEGGKERKSRAMTIPGESYGDLWRFREAVLAERAAAEAAKLAEAEAAAAELAAKTAVAVVEPLAKRTRGKRK